MRHYGVIPGDLEAVTKVLRALRRPDRVLHFVYEAGPCGLASTATSRHRTKTAWS
jgi:hypothetical protein